MTPAHIWETLGLEPTEDIQAIRRAYAKRLKAMDPDTDPDGFMALREAREWALHQASQAGPTLVCEPPSAIPADFEAGPKLSDQPDSIATDQAAAEERDAPVGLDQHAPDIDAINLLHAMIFDLETYVSADQIAEQTERVLADPAMLSIDHGERVEAFIAQTIVDGTPRSDAMIDPAVDFFRWDAPDRELRRPPIVNWILQRGDDRYFEGGLASSNPGYHQLLDRLRQAPPSRARWSGWWLAPRMEYLIAYLDTNHPTVLAGVNSATLAWWTDEIRRQHAMPVLGRLYRIRRQTAWDRGFNVKNSSILFFIGVLLFPYLFAWFLLRRGHSWRARLVGFGWLALVLSAGILDKPQPSAPTVPIDAARFDSPVMPITPFVNLADDLNPTLARMTDGSVDFGLIELRNPELGRRLRRVWRASQIKGDTLDAFLDRAQTTLYAAFSAALAHGDGQFVRDFAGFYTSRLRWAARASPSECVAIVNGGHAVAEPSSVADYQRKLLGRALLMSVPLPENLDAVGNKAPSNTRIPEKLFQVGLERSQLKKADFESGLLGKGSDVAQCNARIALVDAAVLDPGDDGVRFLRAVFGNKSAV